MSDQVREIKEKVDIVSIVGRRVDLKRAGKHFKGLCPFHGENSPSFFVSPELQVYKCFGCGESGDVFSFLQNYEGLSFREALEQLAEQTGVKLESYKPDRNEEEVKRYYQILNLAKEFYSYLLLNHSVGQVARDYLKGRDISLAQISQFNLGFAPDTWDTLVRYLHGKKKFSLKEIEACGLISLSAKGGFDRFRGRIMFPLTDFRGRVVGFSGRLIEDKPNEGKYINTPETKIYHKRELLFGLDQARSAIRKKNRAILVEGEFDVISSFAAGVYHTVGIKGSAVTEEQVRLLMRLTKNLTLCLDADSAGDAATKRGIEMADKLGVEVTVVSVIGGKDPDELARSDSKTWKALVKKPVSAYQFYIDSATSRYDLASASGKKAVAEELVPMLAKITNSVEQAFYIDKVAILLGVTADVIRQEIDRFGRKQQLGVVAQATKSEEAPDTQIIALEKLIWSQFLAAGSAHTNDLWQQLDGVAWVHPGLAKLATLVRQLLSSKQTLWVSALVKKSPPELSGLIEALYLNQDTLAFARNSSPAKEIATLVMRHKQLALKIRLNQLSLGIGKLEKQTQLTPEAEQELTRLKTEFASLLAQKQ